MSPPPQTLDPQSYNRSEAVSSPTMRHLLPASLNSNFDSDLARDERFPVLRPRPPAHHSQVAYDLGVLKGQPILILVVISPTRLQYFTRCCANDTAPPFRSHARNSNNRLLFRHFQLTRTRFGLLQPTIPLNRSMPTSIFGNLVARVFGSRPWHVLVH